MAEWRDHVKVVRLQWLRDCCAQGQYIEPDAGACLTAAALMPKGQACPPFIDAAWLLESKMKPTPPDGLTLSTLPTALHSRTLQVMPSSSCCAVAAACMPAIPKRC
eukprot:1001622-Pelagomonas_calceolata.AAC.1